ncbi:MAG: phosphoribosylglycinamide formyltransferase [bacterium]|nr:phosphoribosylglycinamide formyltransferase [bacterium]
MNIAVFASTNGTNLQAVLDEVAAGRLPNADLRLVLVNKQGCGAAEKAKKAAISVIFIDPRDEQGQPLDRETYDRQLAEHCQKHDIDLIVLVGWMRILSPWFVRQYPRKIINIHPSLLPKYPGMDLDVHQAVLDSGDKETGMTIHYVDEQVDHGQIILQKTCPVLPGDTADSLKKRVQELEKQWYPEVIRELTEAH